MTDPRVDANGFPHLERDPAPIPELPDHPTPLELARAYGSVTLAWYRQWPRIVDALQFLYGAVMGAKGEAEAARREAHAARLAAQGRALLPSMHEYNPDLTPAGGIRVSPDAWTALQHRLAELDAARKTAEDESRGAQKALEKVEERQKKRRDSLLLWGTLLSPFVLAALTGLGVLIAHWLHL